MALLRTKLNVPHLCSDLLERLRLTDRLDEGLKQKLILISAPAGFGKTTLISSWLGRIDQASAWVSLDEQDNDPLRFWSYFIAALQTVAPDNADAKHIGRMSLAMLQSQPTPPVESMVTELLNDTNMIKRDFVLVLDDYHNISNQTIHEGLAFWVDNMSSQSHLVIGSRTRPSLPLPRWRVRNQMMELSIEDIRFTADEAAAFLNLVMGLTLAEDSIAALERLTEGWVAALQLAAISMHGAGDTAGFIKSFSGDNRYIFDYLAEEVLNRQTDDTRRFLLETSILERLSGPLCDAVIQGQGSYKTLERLEQAHLFIVPLDQNREWYRYHHLFSDFLKSQMMRKYSPEHISELHRRASLWNEEHKLLTEAINQALSIPDFELAARLIKLAALSMFPESEIIPLLQWLRSLPESTVKKDVELSLDYVWALLATVQIESIEPHLKDIEKTLGISERSYQNSDIDPALAPIAGQLLCVRANIATHERNYEKALSLSEQANTLLSIVPDKNSEQQQKYFLGLVKFNLALAYELRGDISKASKTFEETAALEQGTGNPHIFPMANGHLAQLEVIQGHLQKAAEIYERTLHSVADMPHPTPLAGMLRTGLGAIYYERNDLDTASTYFKQGIEMGKIWNNWETLVPGYLGLARFEIASGNPESALEKLDELDKLVRKIKITEPLTLVNTYRAWIVALQGKQETAVRYIETNPLSVKQNFSLWQEPEIILRLRTFILLGNPGTALELSEELLKAAQAGKRWGRVIEIMAVRACGLYLLGEKDKAEEALSACLQLAEGEGYVRSIIDNGQPMAKLLETTTEKGSATGYTRKLLEAFESSRKEIREGHNRTAANVIRPSGLVEPLSAREIEVLRLLAAGKTNQEIADTLILSLNTIKTHVKNIHAKLGTHNRTQAANRAQGLGLI